MYNRIWQAVLSLIITFGLVVTAWATVTTYQYNDAASSQFNIQLFECINTPVYCTAMVLEDSSGNEKLTSSHPGVVTGAGTAGTADSNVLTVQGISSMTPVQVSQATASNLNATVVQGTASNLNAEVVGAGTAGSPSGGVVSVQGVSSGTNLNVAQGTASALNATVVGAGTAGSAASGVETIQGIASMTPVQVSQATAGNLNATVVNAGTFAVQDATVEGAISSSVMQSNTKQVNGVTTSTGSGAVGTGSQRVAVGTDTATIAGSAPGTAGSASSNVVTVQGVASMTPVLVTPSAAADPCMSAAKTNFALASSSGNTQVVAGSSGKKVYVCSISIIAGSTAVINFIEGTGGACTTANEAAVIGSTTAASGMSLPANGGFTLGNGGATVAVTATAANGICILQSGTTALAGNVTYVQQ